MATKLSAALSTDKESLSQRIAELSPAIAIDAGRIPRDVLADPMDRLLVATAREMEATLLTADARILQYGVRTRTLRTEDAGR